MPVLLRHARSAYGSAMSAALAEAGYGDIPKSAFSLLGGLARQKGVRPLSELIADLRVSKQAAGQLVDALVTRGYVKRDVDTEDRRRLTVALTTKGRAAANVLADVRAAVDAQLLSRVGARDVERTRRVLSVLIDIGVDLLKG